MKESRWWVVCYHSGYPNVSRGKRNKQNQDDVALCVHPADVSKKRWQKNPARPIRRAYEVDRLVCPKRKGQMRMIAFIEELKVIKQIFTPPWTVPEFRAMLQVPASNNPTLTSRRSSALNAAVAQIS
jgi:hypothetical protein